jgi:hypothetical protein
MEKQKKQDKKQDKNFEKILREEKPSFTIIPYNQKINPDCDLISINVFYDKKAYYADVTTLEYINKLLIDYAFTGENANGLYFRDKNMIILKKITKENIQKTLEDIARYGDLETLTRIHTI